MAESRKRSNGRPGTAKGNGRPSGGRKSSRPKSKGRRALWFLLYGLLAVTVLAAAGLLWIWPRCSGEECPSVEALRSYTPPQASRVFDRTGQVIAHLAPERRIVVPLEKIPAHVA